MKTISIIFDKRSGEWDDDDMLRNMHHVCYVRTWAEAKCKMLGYVYLNEIYERLGVAWDPFWENICMQQDVNDIVKITCDCHILKSGEEFIEVVITTINHDEEES